VETARVARGGILWLALGLAFLPVLIDLLRHVAVEPWARYALLFPVLFVRCALRAESRPAPARDGWVWLALGMGVDLLAVAGGSVRLGRPGLALAAVGLCRLFGFARLPVALLTLWAVPVPRIVLDVPSPHLESLVLGVAAGAANLLGAGVVVKGWAAQVGGLEFKLHDYDGGLILLALTSGLGWYAGLMARAGWTGCAWRALLGALAGLPLQILGVTLALGALAWGRPDVGRALLDHGLWLAVALGGIAWAERGVRAS
jgi:hypothetical protein